MSARLELITVPMEKPEELNLILGQAHGASPLGVETEQEVTARHDLLRAIGYKL
jgi:adenosine/AMP kinase